MGSIRLHALFSKGCKPFVLIHPLHFYLMHIKYECGEKGPQHFPNTVQLTHAAIYGRRYGPGDGLVDVWLCGELAELLLLGGTERGPADTPRAVGGHLYPHHAQVRSSQTSTRRLVLRTLNQTQVQQLLSVEPLNKGNVGTTHLSLVERLSSL